MTEMLSLVLAPEAKIMFIIILYFILQLNFKYGYHVYKITLDANIARVLVTCI